MLMMVIMTMIIITIIAIIIIIIIVSPKKLDIGLRTTNAGIPYALLLRIEAVGFPTFELLYPIADTVDDRNPALPYGS